MSRIDLNSAPETRAARASAGLSRRKLWAFRLVGIGFGAGVAFLAIEILLRLLASQPHGTMEDLRRFQEVKKTGQQLSMINLIRPGPAEAPRIVYEMIPGVEGRFWGGEVRINREGFFDADRSVEKPAGTYRIVAVGDSVLFGWGVPIGERFSSLLETFLNDTATTGAAGTAPRFEVLNFGVPGYNTLIEAEVMRSRAAKYDPDSVLVVFVPDNDSSLPNFVVKPKKRSDLRRSYLVDAICSRGFGALREGSRPELMGAHGQEVPEEFRYLDGEDAMMQGLAEIGRSAGETSAPVFLMPYFCNPDQLDEDGNVTSAAPPTTPEIAARGMERARQLGFRVIDPNASVGRYLGRKGLVWESLLLDLKRKDAHPNLAYHVLLAKELYRAMAEGGSLPDAKHRLARLEEDMRRWDAMVEEAWTRMKRRQGAGEAGGGHGRPAPGGGA